MKKVFITCFALLTYCTAFGQYSDYNDDTPIGLNLSGQNDICGGIVFKDLTKACRVVTCDYEAYVLEQEKYWKDRKASNYTDWSLLSPEKSNDNGYPNFGEDAMLYWELHDKTLTWSNDTMLLLYEGKGKITSNLTLISSEQGKIKYKLDKNIIQIVISNTVDESNPLKYIRFINEKDSADYWTNPFREEFLNEVKIIKAFRFMDWGNTNKTTATTWSNKYWRFEGHINEKVRYDDMITLCNINQSDAWICVPHGADDDYVNQLATKIKGKINPGLKVYIELSNEVTNSGYFEEGQYNYFIALADELGYDDLELIQNIKQKYSDDKSVDYYVKNAKICLSHAKKTAIVHKIFSEILGEENIVRVLPAHDQEYLSGENIIDWYIAEFGKAPEVWSPNGYIGYQLGGKKLWQIVKNWDNELIFDYVLNKATIPQMDNYTGTLDELIDKWAKHKKIAEKYTMEMVAYEGGQHFSPNDSLAKLDQEFVEKFKELQRNPRIKELYKQLLDAWKEQGGTTFFHFVNTNSWDKHGSYGWKNENFELGRDHVDAMKYDALLTWIENNTEWYKSNVSNCIEDAYTRIDNPTANANDWLLYSNTGSKLGYSFIKFKVPAHQGKLMSAKLHFYADDSSSYSRLIKSVEDNSWRESEITWNNKPETLETVAVVDYKHMGWHEYSLNTDILEKLIKSDSVISFAITPIDNNGEGDYAGIYDKDYYYGGKEFATKLELYFSEEIQQVNIESNESVFIDSRNSDTAYVEWPLFSNAGSKASYSIIKFDFPNENGLIKKARLHLYANGASNTKRFIKVIEDDSWINTMTTWDNQPTLNETIGQFYYEGEGWNSIALDVDLLKHYVGDNILSLAIVSETEGDWKAAENSYSANKPTLELEFNEEWEELLFTDFETGWQQWQSGGSDAQLYYSIGEDDEIIVNGNICAVLRDNNGSRSAITLKNNLDLDSPGYTQIKFEFWYRAVSMDNEREDFFLEFFDGSNWKKVKTYLLYTDFINDTLKYYRIILNNIDSNFTSQNNFRIRCDASGRQDYVYIDDIKISAKTTPVISTSELKNAEIKTEIKVNSNTTNTFNTKLYPNPVSQGVELNIELIKDSEESIRYIVTDINGRLVQNGVSNDNHFKINTQKLQSGLYLIQIHYATSVQTYKLLVK